MSLIDRLSGVMDPEELPQLGVLIDWADPMDAWGGHYGALSVGGE